MARVVSKGVGRRGGNSEAVEPESWFDLGTVRCWPNKHDILYTPAATPPESHGKGILRHHRLAGTGVGSHQHVVAWGGRVGREGGRGFAGCSVKGQRE